MKNLVKLLISAFLAANCHSILATSIEAGGTIYGNITWDADTVKIISDILVDNYATLTIEPGTRIEFKDLYNFNVEGRLLAEGEPGNEIIFTVDDTAGYHNFTHKGWNGITFDYTYIDSYSVDTSKLNHCIVEYAKSRGIKVAEFNKLVVSNCIIRHNKGGLAYASSKCLAVNNIVYGNLNAENGGAYNIFLAEETRIINNTLCNNKSVHGGSIYIEDYIWGPIIIKNTVSWGNSASVEGKEVYLKWLNTYYDYKPEFHYCNIEGGLESFHHLGNGCL
jgi:hypothetical protein